MAYAAVISLKNTIHRFLNSSRMAIVSTSRAILETAHAEATSLQQVLKRLDDRKGSKRLDALDGRMRGAVHKIEDVLEFHESDKYFSSQSESYGEDGSSRILPIDLEEVREEIHSLVHMVKELKEEYIKELQDEVEEDDDNDDDDYNFKSSSIDFGVEIVGLSSEYSQIKAHLVKRMRPDDFVVLRSFGMAGTCRTLAAKAVYDDLCTGEEPLFDCSAWVSVGPKYEFKEILLGILAQIDDEVGTIWELADEKSIVEYLYTSLKGRRCMIVLDDVWDARIVHHTMRCFPEHDNGSVLMFTTSIKAVREIPTGFHRYAMRALQEPVVRDFLRQFVFGFHESCPPELEEAEKKIVQNTQGCRMQIIKAILFLKKAEKTPECWNKLATDDKNPIFVVDDEISEICNIKEDIQLHVSILDDVLRENVIEFLDVSDEAELVKMDLFPIRFFPKMEIISFWGMAGIGKTTLVKKLYADPSIFHDTDHRAWITLGPNYHSEDILVDILAEIYPDNDKRHLKADAGLAKILYEKLSLKKCLIVLDDVWNQNPLHYLKKKFPSIKGRVMVTTRLLKVAQFEQSDTVYKVRLLNLEESWCLFCQKVFANGLCPPKLEKVGRKIAENCEGLPLLILTVADLLSKAEKTLEYWNEVAEKKNALFANAQNKISKILLPSYKSLPQHLKAFFLYMGVFPERYHIPVSKLINLWNAEGFFELDLCQNVEDFVAECLLELYGSSTVMVCQMNSSLGVKTCSLHSVFWHLSIKQALKSVFFHALNTYNDHLVQEIEIQRRLCIRNNILLSIKDVRNSIASISSAHSLLCNGQPHQYQVPIYFDSRLLRVMDTLTIRLYEFPIDLVKLIHLRYLALTYNGKFPTSISKLWNLQFLIVCRHLTITSSENSSYLPVEIWEMKELRHLQIMGGCLPNPNHGAVLPNLVTLLDVSAQSCTKKVLKRIPNIKKLGIRIELAPNSDGNLFRCLNCIWRLRKLESLKCVVVNPELRSNHVTPPAPRSMFPPCLKKLSLSGLGYPWEYMSMIGKLHNLEVLKLRCFAFQGPKWETAFNQFTEVKFLSIEDTDLVHWGVHIGSLLELKHLRFRHCYNLKELPDNLLSSIEKIEIVDCNPWTKQMKELSVWTPSYWRVLEFQSSWDVEYSN